jgi:hypothetical protein
MSFEWILNGQGGGRLAEQTFSRYELSLILNVYGRMVAAGKWRDYAIDHRRDRAVFSIFRGTAEMPIYRVEKTRGDGPKQNGYAVIGLDGCILGRGPDLQKVLRVLERKLIRLVD